jgi:TnpA family transposase
MITKTNKTPNKDFHNNPPLFKSIDRKRYFYVDDHFKTQISSTVRGNANFVFIIVAYGYFKATGQFFDSARQEDIDYVAGRLKLSQTYFWKNYKKNTRDRHRKMILSSLGYKPFSLQTIKPLLQTIRNNARSQKNPKMCFVSACEWLFQHKIETPDFDTIVETIQSVYKAHRDEQFAVVKRTLAKSDAALLDGLFEKSNKAYDNMETHRLNLLKKFKQSTKTNNIRSNIEALDLLKPLYDIAHPVVQQLDFSQDGIKRFALSVHRRQVFQIKRLRESDRHLQLCIYIVYQFNQLVDTLIDIFLASVKSAINTAEVKAKDEYYRQRKEQSAHTQQLVSNTESLVVVVEKLRSTLNNPTLSDSEKVAQSLKLISPKRVTLTEITDSVHDVQEDLAKLSGQALFMKYLEEGARSLQLKCNDIVCRLSFESDDPTNNLLKAIRHYQTKQGKVSAYFPIGFLESAEKHYVDDEEGFRKQLYKVLLFKHMANAIKGGSLNVLDSTRYQQLDQYLIPKPYYQKHRMQLLKLADMEEFSDVNVLLDELELTLDAQFQETNEHILANKNEFVEPDGLGGFKLVSERNTQEEALTDSKIDIDLFPKDNYIGIAEATSTVNSASKFLDEFEHNSIHHLKKRPDNKHFIAGIIALGEHFTVPKLSNLSPQIDLSSLESTTNGYFNLESVRRANDSIVMFVNQLPLAKAFENEYGLQTSSDGQKWPIAYESLNANRSFKYGGRDPVVAAYTFIDSRGMFPYSTVISGAEREAHYMVDGVLKNDVVKSDMHSTDTHGYTEAIFGLTHLLKISFAPRIKNPGKRDLYSFLKPSHYKRKKYEILPKYRTNKDKIKTQWEEMLRLAISIKLGEVTASQIFKRLNSYSAKNNPLYEALKTFGGISKTLFILRYADDVDLRKAIHKQLNKGEAGNKLDRALAIGRKEYTQTLKEDQQIAETCKRLLKNVVVCWNFMYLSKRLSQCKTGIERTLLLRKIKASSMLAWEHFVFCGVFDFSDSALKDSQNFDFERMMDPDLLK